MRIYLTSGHHYPGRIHGVAAHMVHDYLARGLGELGHEVRYHLRGWRSDEIPEGVIPVTGMQGDEDILHLNDVLTEVQPSNEVPWVLTVHSDVRYRSLPPEKDAPSNWIFVSESLAKLYGSRRFVYNGVDPAELIYSETKEDYFLFVVKDVCRARVKGLEIAFRISELTGIELRVAGGTTDLREAHDFARLCKDHGAIWVGYIQGQGKAELFAGAKGLLFTTQYANEAFGLVLIEALFSGTPVIGSHWGAIPELLPPHAGFVCRDEAQYVNAITNISSILPADCRRYALDHFHYLDMARAYVKEYALQIAERAS
jgi:glycosyltransferase involved in cell wall biosynthesis